MKTESMMRVISYTCKIPFPPVSLHSHSLSIILLEFDFFTFPSLKPSLPPHGAAPNGTNRQPSHQPLLFFSSLKPTFKGKRRKNSRKNPRAVQIPHSALGIRILPQLVQGVVDALGHHHHRAADEARGGGVVCRGLEGAAETVGGCGGGGVRDVRGAVLRA